MEGKKIKTINQTNSNGFIVNVQSDGWVRVLISISKRRETETSESWKAERERERER